ncbi:MAG: uncharacterized protein JWN34_3077 [Bryobacterales bacterium]|jgi:hypothetical protein|nr:uncharacterized protein [Bryobacterales bacterium]
MRVLHKLHKVRKFDPVAPFTLRAQFDDNSVQTIDFEPVLRGELYGPLRDPGFFNQVAPDPQARTLIWPNGADFDPATLHDWPECGGAFIRMARGWADQPGYNRPASV